VRGDVVLSIDGEEPSFPGDVEAAGGLYRLSRQGKIFEMKLVPEGLTENLEPKLRAMDAGGGVGLLELPSFLPQYFDERAWRALASRLTSYTALVVDLRGNAGGSFPAMLRALSPFLCEQKQIGVVYQAPAGRKLREAALRDQLDTNSQLEQLEEADSLRLMTFDGYGCFRGPVVALIDGETASVAEIFAQALFARPRSRVWGQFSSGRVVMAEWFNVHGFGEPPSMLSVPIAGYVASDGVEIEGRGIEPERTLYYELQDALLGRDNWVESARTAVSK
jgi:carboxyl-terminal processing protease